MRRFLGTSLIMVLLFTLGSGALSSPDVNQRGCVVTLKLDGAAAFDQPLARWLTEICDMVNLTVRCARWDGAESVSLALTMGSVRAFDLSLLRIDGQTTLTGSLTDAPVALPNLCDWADELLGAAGPLLALPSSGRSIALSGEGLAQALKKVSIRLRAWAATARATAGRACEACGACEVCDLCEWSEAIALVIDAIAERFDEVVDLNVLVVDSAPFDVVEVPGGAYKAEPAADDLNVRLVKDALWAIGRAIANNPLPDPA